MITIKHRINTISQLLTVDDECGVETDIRVANGKLVLAHDPYNYGEDFESFLKIYNHKVLVLNIKDSGIEDDVIEITKKYLDGKDFFLLDVEIPYLVSKKGVHKEYLSCRFSEFETFESLINFRNHSDWVWIDTFNNLPDLNKDIVEYLYTKKTCLVSPKRWGREDELGKYLDTMKFFNFKPNFVMV